jgi:hypothetical protein
MKIQFEFSAADVADTALRIAKHSKTARDSREHFTRRRYVRLSA